MTTGTDAPHPPLAGAIDYTWPRRVVLLVPLLLVNTVAVYGQYSWALVHLDDPGLTATFPNHWTLHLLPALFAGAMESVALYLQHEANVARLAGDPVAKLATASYVVAGVAGLLNFLHWHDKNLSAALAFGLLSVISPWLWGIRSRSEHREQLRACGLIETRAVTFSTARWVLYPAATFHALRLAVWVGEQNPQAAVALWEARPVGEPRQRWWHPTPAAPPHPTPSIPTPPVAAVEMDTVGTDILEQQAVRREQTVAGKEQRDREVAWCRQELDRTPSPTMADIARRGAQRFGVSTTTMERRLEAAKHLAPVRNISTG